MFLNHPRHAGHSRRAANGFNTAAATRAHSLSRWPRRALAFRSTANTTARTNRRPRHPTLPNPTPARHLRATRPRERRARRLVADELTRRLDVGKVELHRLAARLPSAGTCWPGAFVASTARCAARARVHASMAITPLRARVAQRRRRWLEGRCALGRGRPCCRAYGSAWTRGGGGAVWCGPVGAWRLTFLALVLQVAVAAHLESLQTGRHGEESVEARQHDARIAYRSGLSC